MLPELTCFSDNNALNDLITFFKKHNYDNYENNIDNLKKVARYCTKTIDNIDDGNNEVAKIKRVSTNVSTLVNTPINSLLSFFKKTLNITSELSRELQNKNDFVSLSNISNDDEILDIIDRYPKNAPFILILKIFKKMTDTYLAHNYAIDRHNGSTYTNDTTYYLYFENVDITKFRCYFINDINVNKYRFSTNNSIVYNSYNKGFLNNFGNIQSIQYKIIPVSDKTQGGGKYSVKTQFKEVLGKKMRIYKIANSRKEHVNTREILLDYQNIGSLWKKNLIVRKCSNLKKQSRQIKNRYRFS